jgi:UDP-2,3-diacylglucosamine hydrolase
VPAPEALSSAVAGAQEIRADGSWQVVDFISDLHLQAKDPATFAAWQHYMRQTPADALFILGDLFEVWVGDDLITAAHDPQAQFVAQCQQVLQEATRRMAVFFMHGNRDFMLGHSCAGHCKLQLLNDPSVLVFDGQRWLVSHGDALCLDDTEYQQFRQQVRSPGWQADFLAKPLVERQQIARGLREHSDARKGSGAPYADVDAQAARDWLNATGASTLIHGHTHRPAEHVLDTSTQPPLRRLVLSDWDASAQPPRLEVLRLKKNQAPQRLKLNPTPDRSGL